MIPSPLASVYLYGRRKTPFTGKPTESRVLPVPIVLLGLPAGSTPSDSTLLLLWDAEMVMSHPSARRSISVALSCASSPEFCTPPRFVRTLVADGDADGAIGRLMSASRVFLL